jgi:hypothetical protein
MGTRDSGNLASSFVDAKVNQETALSAQGSYAIKRARGDIEYDEHRSSSEADRVTLLMNKLIPQYDIKTKKQLVSTDIERQEFQIRVYYLIDAVDRLTISDEDNTIIDEANKFINGLPENITKTAKLVVKSTVDSIAKRVKTRAEARRAGTSKGGGHYKLRRYGKTRRRYGKARRTRKTR